MGLHLGYGKYDTNAVVNKYILYTQHQWKVTAFENSIFNSEKREIGKLTLHFVFLVQTYLE